MKMHVLKISWALSVFQSLWSSRSNDALSWKAGLLNNIRKVVHKNKTKVELQEWHKHSSANSLTLSILALLTELIHIVKI